MMRFSMGPQKLWSWGAAGALRLCLGLLLATAMLLPSLALAADPFPEVDNAAGATDVTTISATLNGTLVSDSGGLTTTVRVFWGESDGQEVFADWDTAVDLGAKAEGPVSEPVSGLVPGRSYFYRFFATNVGGEHWASPSSTFTTPLALGPVAPNLGTTKDFTILAGAAVTTTGGGIINGNVGCSPIAGAAMGLTDAQVNGIIYVVDATGPAGSVIDPTLLTTAKGDLTIAFNEAAGRTPIPAGPFLNPGAGNIGGLTLIPGLYKFTSTAMITGANLTLAGGPNDVWIFQIAADLQVGSGVQVILAGGAKARNIYWQVGTSAVIETTAVFKGTIIADQSIVMKTGSTLEGRALAFEAGVTFDGGGGDVPVDNNAPVALPDAFSLDKNTTLTVGRPGVLANDTDLDGDPLTAVLVLGVNDGVLTLRDNGAITYTPDLNFVGIDTFTYEVSDGTATSNQVTVTITVNQVNSAPVAEDDSYTMTENGTLTEPAPGVLVNDTDAESILLTALLETDVTNGTLLLNADGSFVYTPTPGYSGPDSFTYRANDGDLDSEVATVLIDILPLFDLVVVNGTGSGSFSEGTIVPVVAVIPVGKVFDQWTGDIAALADANSAATSATIPAADITVTAEFVDAPPATFTLTVVNGTGGGSYAAGTIVPVIATVPIGKVFDQWSGNVGILADANAAATSATMPGNNVSITAEFVDAPPATFTLTVVNGTGSGSYIVGAVVPVVATIPVGKVFDRWSGNTAALADANAAATSATMPANNITVTALFVDAPPATFTLTVVNGTGGGSYVAGTIVPVIATVPIGKVFSAWTGNIGILADATASATTATMPAANVTVTALFVDAPPATFTLTVVNGTGSGSYIAGAVVPVIATIPVGKNFDRWSGNTTPLADPNAAATSATMPANNITVTALFVDAPPATFTLTVVNGTGGGSYVAGTVVPVIATVPAGKVFDQWSGNIAILADPSASATSATIPAANTTITALFVDAPPATFTLTVVNGTGSGAYTEGTTVPVIAIVPIGKVFDQWTGNTAALADPNAAATVATMPAANITVTALFVDAPPATFTLAVVNGTGSGAYPTGTVVLVDATVPAGKVFSAWTGDIAALTDPNAATTLATMPAANITVTALFVDAPPATFTLLVINGTGDGAYVNGAVVPIAATIPAGKTFRRWAGDVSTLADANAANTTVTMPAANVTVTAIFNSPPVAADDAFAVDSDNLLLVPAPGVMANDSDLDSGAVLAVAVLTDPVNGVLVLDADGSFSYFPNDGYAGPDSFTYTVSDGFNNDSATVSLTVNALARTLSINNISRAEADNLYNFVVTLSESSGRDVSVDFATSEQTATAPEDYVTTLGAVTIPAGELTATIPVIVKEDTIFELSEAFRVTLSNPTRASLGTPIGTGTITNDDLRPLVTLSVSPASIGEAGGVATVTATLSNPSFQDITVNLGFAGTADGLDYSPSANSILIPALSLTGEMTIAATDDAIDEPGADETVLVSLTTVVNGSAVIPQVVTVAIVDNDQTPTLTIDDATVNEADGTATFTVTLTGLSQQDISVDFSSLDGTATDPADYAAVAGTRTWLSGSTGTRTFTVAIAEDDLDEADETADLLLSAPVNANITDGVGLLTILDNDLTPTVAIDDVTVNEAAGTALFTVTLTGKSQQDITVGFSSLDSTATAPADYTTVAGTRTWLSGSTGTRTFSVVIVNDDLDEGDETAIVALDFTAYPTITDGVGLLTIIDDEPTPTLAIDDVTVNEGAGTATFTVTLTGQSQQDISIPYVSTNGTATAPADYAAVNSSFTWLSGSTGAQTFTVAIVSDDLHEGNESAILSLGTSLNATVTKGVGLLTILDDEATPSLAIDDVTVNEEDGTALFTVILTGMSQQDISIPFSSSNGTATATADFTAISGTRTWLSGSTGARTFSVAIINDDLDEDTEFAQLSLGTSLSAVVTKGLGVLTILDNDQTPTLAISDATVNEVDGTATITVTLTGTSQLPITVSYGASTGTATALDDYTVVSSTLTWASGSTGAKTFTVAIVNDDLYEGSETVNLVLGAATNAVITDAVGELTILDSETIPTLAIADVTVNEDVGTATISVTLTGKSQAEVSLPFASSNGSATAPDDYTAVTGTLTWPSGSTGTRTFGVVIVNDDRYEDNETVNLTLGATLDATVTKAVGVLTILDTEDSVVIYKGRSGTRFVVLIGSASTQDGVTTVTGVHWLEYWRHGRHIKKYRIRDAELGLPRVLFDSAGQEGILSAINTSPEANVDSLVASGAIRPVNLGGNALELAPVLSGARIRVSISDDLPGRIDLVEESVLLRLNRTAIRYFLRGLSSERVAADPVLEYYLGLMARFGYTQAETP